MLALQQRIAGPDGRPSLQFMQYLRALERRLAASEARLAAIAEVADPTGGATTDAEARVAINAIIAAAQ